MTHEEAHAVLSALADGYDPRTGEALPPDGLWSDPTVLRALFAALEALCERPSTHRQRPPRTLPANAGSTWTLAEDDALRSEYETEKSATRLARLHGRTAGAMTSRLGRLGLLATPSEAGTAAATVSPQPSAELESIPKSDVSTPADHPSGSAVTETRRIGDGHPTDEVFVFRVTRKDIFLPEERALLRENGALLQALADGSLEPENRVQEQFVAVCRAGGPATNEFERVWLKYCARLSWEANPENEGISDEVVVLPDPDRQYYSEKVAKGAKFFQRRRHP